MSNPTSVIELTDDLAGFLARTNQFGEANQLLIQPKRNKSPGNGVTNPGFPASSSVSNSVAQYPNMIDDFLLKFFGWTGGTETMGASSVALKFAFGLQIGTASLLADAGDPEGVVTAGVGSIFLRTDGASGTTIYTKATGAGNTGWETVGGGGAAISTIDASGLSNVVSEYTFDTGDDLQDVGTAANSYDLTMANTETYITIEGKRALYFRENSRADEAAGPGNSPNLQITGALTIYTLRYDNDGRMNGTPYTPGFGATGETEATNFLYSFQTDSTGRQEVFWEEGAGGNVLEQLEYAPPVGRWTLLTLTRAADGTSCKVYHNGVEFISFTAANAATGGTSGELFIDDYMGYIGGIVVCDAEHSAGTIAAVAAQVGVS